MKTIRALSPSKSELYDGEKTAGTLAELNIYAHYILGQLRKLKEPPGAANSAINTSAL